MVMEDPFHQISLFSSHDEVEAFFHSLDDEPLNKFFDFDLLQIEDSIRYSNPCSVCLNLDPDKYKLLECSQLRARLYQLYISAKRQCCITCLIVFNTVMSQLRYDVMRYDQRKKQQTPLDWVTISLRPGYVPHITWSADFGFDVLSRSETGSPWNPALASFAGSKCIPDEPSLEHCLSFVRPLLQECGSSHTSSCQPTAKVLPKRLLDIVNGIKLVNTDDKNILQSNWKYIALSHCWGETRPIETKKSNLNQHHKAIEWGKLSKTFQDAIRISRGLDIKYIWIDSLCIIQDDPIDWEIEAAKMASVYSGSYLTVAATGSKNGHGGCLFNRPTFETDLIEVYADQNQTKFFALPYRYIQSHSHFTGNSRGILDPAPLLSRAWCFQERLLSPRILHFHGLEMVWECSQGSSCECGFLDRAARFGNTRYESSRRHITRAWGDTTETERHNAWFKVIEQYSVLDITRESDRFPALAGLASRFSDKPSRGRYLAGLWEDDLWRGLTWMPHQGPHRRNASVPAWSWASMEYFERPVDPAGPQYRDHRGLYFWQDREGYRHIVVDKNLELLSVEGVHSDDGLSFMRGQGISLKVRGLCARTTPTEPNSYTWSEKPFSISWDVDGELKGAEEVVCLLLGIVPKSGRDYDDIGGHGRFLVLEELAPSGSFRRIGMGETFPERPGGNKLFGGAECAEVE
ncbi:heterokaryon incompatibility protein-domain-containing protein, partial [Cladorrhinum sp. PSN332]